MDEAMRQDLSRQIAGLAEHRQQGDEEFAAALRELAAFTEERGGVPDYRSEESPEARLGAWLQTQRSAEQGHTLCSERRSMLANALGPGWASPN